MKTSRKWPKKFLNAIPNRGSRLAPQFYLVIDAATNEPQCFEYHKDEEYMGAFYPAKEDLEENDPVCLFDRETALFLISQHAVYMTITDGWCIDHAPMFRLLPVFGAMIPDCLTSNPAV